MRLALLITSILSFGTLQAITPDEALKALQDGNQRYMTEKLLNFDNNTARRATLFSKQSPFATILGCSDSRVSPEIVFDQALGDLFVVRVAGNVVAPIELDSIDYSVLYLGSRLILVLGHENCGAVKAVLEGNTKDIEAIASKIEPAIQGISPTDKDNPVKRAVLANIRQSVSQLSISPVLARHIKSGQIKIVGGYYDLLSGQVIIIPLEQLKK